MRVGEALLGFPYSIAMRDIRSTITEPHDSFADGSSAWNFWERSRFGQSAKMIKLGDMRFPHDSWSGNG
jgi:hypothetical protein